MSGDVCWVLLLSTFGELLWKARRSLLSWGQSSERRGAQITRVVILLFGFQFFFIRFTCFCCCSQRPVEQCSRPRVCLLTTGVRGLSGLRRLKAVQFQQIVMGMGGGEYFPHWHRPVSLSTFCSSTELICLKETVVSGRCSCLSSHLILLCHCHL